MDTLFINHKINIQLIKFNEKFTRKYVSNMIYYKIKISIKNIIEDDNINESVRNINNEIKEFNNNK